jgi:hypothetical protein
MKKAGKGMAIAFRGLCLPLQSHASPLSRTRMAWEARPQ